MKIRFVFKDTVIDGTTYEPDITFMDNLSYEVLSDQVLAYLENTIAAGYVYMDATILDGEMKNRNLIDFIDIRPALPSVITAEDHKDNVNHPSHYNSGQFEVIDIIDEFGKDYKGSAGFCFGNVVKYILRAKHKNGLEDLRKAKWYLDRLIDTWEE